MHGYKVIIDGRGAYTNYQYAMPTRNADGSWAPGAWMTTQGQLEHCANGFHFCGSLEQIFSDWWRYGGVIYEVETGSGVLPPQKNKWVARDMRILREVEKPAWLVGVEEFIAGVKTMFFFSPTAPLKLDYPHRVFETRAVAATAAAWDVHNAARNAAFTAANNAASDANRDNAFVSVSKAVFSAVGDAAREAALFRVSADEASYVAGDAAFSAATLYVRIECICADLPIEQRHRDYARARWSVYQQGYAVLNDIDGVLYCYKVGQ